MRRRKHARLVVRIALRPTQMSSPPLEWRATGEFSKSFSSRASWSVMQGQHDDQLQGVDVVAATWYERCGLVGRDRRATVCWDQLFLYACASFASARINALPPGSRRSLSSFWSSVFMISRMVADQSARRVCSTSSTSGYRLMSGSTRSCRSGRRRWRPSTIAASPSWPRRNGRRRARGSRVRPRPGSGLRCRELVRIRQCLRRKEGRVRFRGSPAQTSMASFPLRQMMSSFFFRWVALPVSLDRAGNSEFFNNTCSSVRLTSASFTGEFLQPQNP